MFAGINFIETEEDQLTGMRSKENETVDFIRAFKIADYKKINNWLDELEYQMQVKTLVLRLMVLLH